MAPQQDGWEKEERGPPPWVPQDFDVTIVTTISSYSQTFAEESEPTSMAFQTQSLDDNDTQTRRRPSTRPDGYPSTLPWPPYGYGGHTATTNPWEMSISKTAVLSQTPYPELDSTLLLSITNAFPTTTGAPSSTIGSYGGRPSGWEWSQEGPNKAPVYAAAAIVPIIILVMIGAVTLVCLRRRKKRRAEAAVQEMKLEPDSPTIRPHMAPLPAPIPAVAVSQHYTAPPAHLPPTSSWNQPQPIIIGPIVSSSNGAYLTGMDTSDMVSITSNNRMSVDPFSDSYSLSGPPPPYRPSSVPPPSFTSNSRHSSVRLPASPVCLARSPFDDPEDSMLFMEDGEVQGERYVRAYTTR
ncbi:hypothetical protein COCCADRAFT_105460 [Bipolaris zeicola 26-R-13]|uniref:Uncharacterized protein n=1 Tax=Cochliobolus carbonum (strain 26-R-13) TaxID=930089 RepID=W6XX77_COCC2|nr:uncharacterized protein COCCADRAFT_105460 [Bipolaris zeicola 26-R-13]EUC29840.1 hypothetical protein COCCADRAFT_105460 [Bipolaris zeicola 26-R-13]